MWALIVDNTVVEVTLIDPEGRFHTSMNWMPCSFEVQPGHRLIDGTLVPSEYAHCGVAERAWRDAQLMSSEWLVSRHREELDMNLQTTLSSEHYSELLSYRQMLRTWPQDDVFPDQARHPLAPSWLIEHIH
ncbi:phage tail assembly chaperone [Pseudomonas entomophila]|uniref:phage tail assembly chaperone n=1 Tax=Pseudomonas entomophila TaxID=312306 RepID=UPI0023D7F627|nr:phage tail assembly chaperone [Pseudomonas entomophila]MDF0730552.1 phage tail assembly chaperone [Pseudomonas entomophila]